MADHCEICTTVSREQFEMLTSASQDARQTLPMWMRETLIRDAKRQSKRRVRAIQRQIARRTYETPDKIAVTAEKIAKEIEDG